MNQRMYKMIYGHYLATDFLGRVIKPKSTIVYAVSNKLRRGKVIDILLKGANSPLVTISCGRRTLTLTPERCITT